MVAALAEPATEKPGLANRLRARERGPRASSRRVSRAGRPRHERPCAGRRRLRLVEVLDLPEAALSDELDGARAVLHRGSRSRLFDGRGGEGVLERGDDLGDLVLVAASP